MTVFAEASWESLKVWKQSHDINSHASGRLIRWLCRSQTVSIELQRALIRETWDGTSEIWVEGQEAQALRPRLPLMIPPSWPLLRGTACAHDIGGDNWDPPSQGFRMTTEWPSTSSPWSSPSQVKAHPYTDVLSQVTPSIEYLCHLSLASLLTLITILPSILHQGCMCPLHHQTINSIRNEDSTSCIFVPIQHSLHIYISPGIKKYFANYLFHGNGDSSQVPSSQFLKRPGGFPHECWEWDLWATITYLHFTSCPPAPFMGISPSFTHSKSEGHDPVPI